MTTWGRLMVVRAGIQQQQQQQQRERGREGGGGSDLRESGWWLVATELLILMGAILWYELVSLVSYQLLHFFLELEWGKAGLRFLANSRVHHLYCGAWYLCVFTRIVLGPFLPQQDLGRHVMKLRGVQGLPAWRAILLDPRIALLHVHSGWEVWLVNAAMAWGRERVLGEGGVMWWRGGGEEGGEEEGWMETPRAPRVGVGAPFFGGEEWGGEVGGEGGSE
jgi:hypothetical protein